MHTLDRGAVKMRVLLADENKEQSKLLCKILKLFGCEIRRASSYQQAISHVLQAAPHVVISSMHLGGYTAQDLAQQIRRLALKLCRASSRFAHQTSSMKSACTRFSATSLKRP